MYEIAVVRSGDDSVSVSSSVADDENLDLSRGAFVAQPALDNGGSADSLSDLAYWCRQENRAL